MSKSFAMATWVCLAIFPGLWRSASAGTVVLTDGTTLQGTVILVDSPEPTLGVQVPGKLVRILKLAEVRQAFLDPRPGEGGSREADGIAWTRTQVGDGRRAGSVQIDGRHIAIRDSSDGFHLGHMRRDNTIVFDGYCLVFQKLEGDGTIQGRVLPSENTKWMRAGLIICQGLEGNGPMALVSRTADPVAGTLITRDKAGGPLATTADARNVEIPSTWLKLTRTGATFKAFESLDGIRWEQLGQVNIPMDDRLGVYIGVAATGNAREGTAAFDTIKLTGKRSLAVVAGQGDSRLPDVCVTLQDGTVLPGSIESIAGDEAKFVRGGAAPAAPAVNLPVRTLARAQFLALTRPQTEKYLAAGAGVLTLDGDFLDGEIKELKAQSVTVSSIAFGLTTIERSRVAGVVFAVPPEKPAAGAGGAAAGGGAGPGLLALRLEDGSLIVTRKVSLEKDQLLLDEPLLGPMKVSPNEVVGLERRGD